MPRSLAGGDAYPVAQSCSPLQQPLSVDSHDYLIEKLSLLLKISDEPCDRARCGPEVACTETGQCWIITEAFRRWSDLWLRVGHHVSPVTGL
ncbi:MAG: hypothetical protein ACKVIQ_08990 [Acidimicrobiales bacterium]|jgi:hypothetical protein